MPNPELENAQPAPVIDQTIVLLESIIAAKVLHVLIDGQWHPITDLTLRTNSKNDTVGLLLHTSNT